MVAHEQTNRTIGLSGSGAWTANRSRTRAVVAASRMTNTSLASVGAASCNPASAKPALNVAAMRLAGRRLQPEIVVQHGLELSRDEAVLAGEMADLLLYEANSLEMCGSADQYRVTESMPFFVPPTVTTSASPMASCGVMPSGGNGIGDSRAVHVDQQVVLVGVVDELRQRGGRPDAAVLGRLGDGDDARLRVMHLAAARNVPIEFLR